jgi:hypothetical protein
MITHVFKDVLINIPIDHLDSMQTAVVFFNLVLNLKCIGAILEEAEVASILYL